MKRKATPSSPDEDTKSLPYRLILNTAQHSYNLQKSPVSSPVSKTTGRKRIKTLLEKKRGRRPSSILVVLAPGAGRKLRTGSTENDKTEKKVEDADGETQRVETGLELETNEKIEGSEAGAADLLRTLPKLSLDTILEEQEPPSETPSTANTNSFLSPSDSTPTDPTLPPAAHAFSPLSPLRTPPCYHPFDIPSHGTQPLLTIPPSEQQYWDLHGAAQNWRKPPQLERLVFDVVLSSDPSNPHEPRTLLPKAFCPRPKTEKQTWTAMKQLLPFPNAVEWKRNLVYPSSTRMQDRRRNETLHSIDPIEELTIENMTSSEYEIFASRVCGQLRFVETVLRDPDTDILTGPTYVKGSTLQNPMYLVKEAEAEARKLIPEYQVRRRLVGKLMNVVEGESKWVGEDEDEVEIGRVVSKAVQEARDEYERFMEA